MKDGRTPAFPYSHQSGFSSRTIESGMSLRDWFAGQALPKALDLAFKYTSVDDAKVIVARTAYEIADAMLKERER
jgi:hypothetical protein